MMEAEIGRGRLPNSGVSLYKDQSVLILNQNSTPCAAAKCDALLHDFLPYTAITTFPFAEIKLIVFERRCFHFESLPLAVLMLGGADDR
jgi:hypothetical protein